MIYWKNQIINPERFRVPTYNISPFSTNQLHLLNDIGEVDDYLITNFLDQKFGIHEYTLNGKLAISKALSFYNLERDDEVYIVTTSGAKYVSSCVTSEIEKYCRWSRVLSDKTKLVFVIHEFGTIYKDMARLLELNLPIVEDLAMSMFSTDLECKAGHYGDFAIYSLPKFFPIQFGGILRYNKREFCSSFKIEAFRKDLRKVLYYFLNCENEIIKTRKSNYELYVDHFASLGIESRLELTSLETPSVYMFSSNTINLDNLKVFMQLNGVESSRFYGENSFFLPVHQNLNELDIRFIVNLVEYFIYENK